MTTELATKTGPGGTELLVRASPLRKKDQPRGAAAPGHQHEHTAYHLRQAVEHAKRENLSDRLALAVQNRQQFWIDTCREVLEMRTAYGQVLELHRQHGCRFWVPTPHHVQHILDALDSAMPRWDCDHPVLFYQTLELNFPELVRAFGARLRA